MKKEDNITPRIQTNTNKTQNQAEKTIKEKDNIKDYDRAWEDDRL